MDRKAFKDMTDCVVKEKNGWYVDREDIDTGREINKAGDRISWLYNGTRYYGLVTAAALGRDDDMLRVITL